VQRWNKLKVLAGGEEASCGVEEQLKVWSQMQSGEYSWYYFVMVAVGDFGAKTLRWRFEAS
jgi:hypothetical protein